MPEFSILLTEHVPAQVRTAIVKVTADDVKAAISEIVEELEQYTLAQLLEEQKVEWTVRETEGVYCVDVDVAPPPLTPEEKEPPLTEEEEFFREIQGMNEKDDWKRSDDGEHTPSATTV